MTLAKCQRHVGDMSATFPAKGAGRGNNSSANDIKTDPNETLLASGEFRNKDYNCREQVHKAYRCPKKNENANRGGDERCD